jgi:catechol 2,3-dioxygenase-like lactoylglutathione lyase family enzyme
MRFAVKIDGLQYVMLASRDIDRSIRFYRDDLGLPLAQQFEGFAFFSCGNTTLVLSSALRDRLHEDGSYPSEVVLGVSSVEAAHDELRACGIPSINAPRQVNAEAWAVTCADPDGHLLSFYGAR